MIVFRNLNPIEINEGDGQIILEIDPSASGIIEETAVEISTIDASAISTSLNDDGTGIDFNAVNNLTTNIDPNNPDTLTFTIDIIDDAIADPNDDFQGNTVFRFYNSTTGVHFYTASEPERDFVETNLNN